MVAAAPPAPRLDIRSLPPPNPLAYGARTAIPAARNNLAWPATALFAMIVVIACAGARLGDGSSLEGFLRSVQLIDLLLPFLALTVLLRFAVVSRIIGREATTTGGLFLVAAGFSSVAGHFVVDRSAGFGVVGISILFFLKEIEFLLVLGFAALLAYDRPQFAVRSLGAGCVFLAFWAIKEYFAPTGLYYAGLPFEAGPSQTGAVYAVFTFVWGAVAIRRWDRAGRFFRYAWVPLIFALLVFGNSASLSRTGQAGLLAGLVAMVLARARSWPVVLLLSPIGYLVYVLAFTDAKSVFDVGFASRWGGAADNFPDRVIKWVAMFDFQRDNPWTFLTGCGFNSPNRYVLYMFTTTTDLGNVLAVDNGYVRRLFEVGLIGAALYLLFLVRLFTGLWRSRYGAVVAGAFLAMATIAVAIESFQVTQTAVAFFLFCGAISGLVRSEAETGMGGR